MGDDEVDLPGLVPRPGMALAPVDAARFSLAEYSQNRLTPGVDMLIGAHVQVSIGQDYQAKAKRNISLAFFPIAPQAGTNLELEVPRLLHAPHVGASIAPVWKAFPSVP